MGKEMQVSTVATPAKLFFFMIAAAFCFITPAAQAESAPAPLGWWLDQTGTGGILIAPCGAKLCGNIEWLKTPLNAQGQPKTDTLNPDPAQQSRLLCGLPILWNFIPDNSGGWTGGFVYDPKSGKTYTSNMHVQADGSLSIRGYIGIPLLGRSAVWTRPPEPLPHCTAAK
jgi:uncharacterized protein (DUF2147 family)